VSQLYFAAVVVVLMLGLATVVPALLGRKALPSYERGKPLLSEAEWTFFAVLRRAIPDTVYIAPKVRIADILEASGPPSGARRAALSRIAQKHVDFAICDLGSFEVLSVVELDDASHDTAKGRKRDALVNSAFASARLPILRIPCRRSYSVEALAELIDEALQPEPIARGRRSAWLQRSA
jgi:hypothetical protein